MNSTTLLAPIWCDDCQKWMPVKAFLRHWHRDDEGTAA